MSSRERQLLRQSRQRLRRGTNVQQIGRACPTSQGLNLMVRMPFLAATVAAPILKLWLEKLPWIPAADKMPRNHDVSKARDKGRPSLSRNNGPEASPLRVKYASREEMAQSGNSPLPICTKQPLRKGSVFEAFMRRRKHEGAE